MAIAADRDDPIRLTFEASQGKVPLAELPDGALIAPHPDQRGRVAAGETWACRIVSLNGRPFAEPIERLAAEPEPPETDLPEEGDEPEADLPPEPEPEPPAMEPEVEAREPVELAEDDRRWRDAEKPVLAPGEDVTDDFIERKILFQLYKQGCWGGKHTSGSHFKKGELKGVSWTRINGVIHRMVSEGLLLPHAKRPDEHYSLQQGAAHRIYAILGVDRSRQGDDAPEPPEPTTSAAPAPEHVTVGTFENTVRRLEKQIRTLQRRVAERPDALPAPSDGLEHRVNDLEGRARGTDARFNRIQAALEDLRGQVRGLEGPDDALAERVARLERRADEPPTVGHRDAATLAATLRSSHELHDARTYLAKLEDAPVPVGEATVAAGFGEPGRCLVQGCDGAPVGFAVLLDLRDEPVVRPGPACGLHVREPPAVVALPAKLNRRSARDAVDTLLELLEALDVDPPPELDERGVDLRGSREAQRQWDLAARKR